MGEVSRKIAKFSYSVSRLDTSFHYLGFSTSQAYISNCSGSNFLRCGLGARSDHVLGEASFSSIPFYQVYTCRCRSLWANNSRNNCRLNFLLYTSLLLSFNLGLLFFRNTMALSILNHESKSSQFRF